MGNLSEDERANGIGGSEIAAILGLSPWADAWTVYARKLHLIEPEPPNERMKWGLRLQRAIAQGFSEEMQLEHAWCDRLIRHPTRPWQFASPDAFVLTSPHQILEIKNVSLDQSGEWDRETGGEDGVPDYNAVQLHWQLSTTDLETGFIAVLIAGNDFRIYQIHRDPEIECILLEEGERFVRDYLLPRVAPPIGGSRTAREYIRRRFPREREKLRTASVAETGWLHAYGRVRFQMEQLEREKALLENALTQAIGDHEGLTWPGGKMTWKRTRDRSEVNWEQLALTQLVGYAEDEKKAIIQQYTEVSHGVRRIHFREEAA